MMDNLLNKVNGRLFMADDVGVATGVAGQALTNLLTRSDLRLASEPPGRGKPRAFPLIDVYQIAIAGDLLRATGSMQRAVQIANRFLVTMVGLPPEGMSAEDWWGAIGAAVTCRDLPDIAPEEFKHALAMADNALVKASVDICNTSPAYWSRDLAKQYYLVADIGGPNFEPLPYAYVTNNPLGFLDVDCGSMTTAILMNLSKLLSRVDEALAKRRTNHA